jgi:hypothetical protein
MKEVVGDSSAFAHHHGHHLLYLFAWRSSLGHGVMNAQRLMSYLVQSFTSGGFQR